MDNIQFKQITEIDDENLNIMTNWMYNWWGEEEGYTFDGVRCFLLHSLQKDRLPQTYGVFCEGTTAAYATLNKRTKEEVEILFQQIETEIRKKSFDWESAVGSYLTILLITLSRYMNDAIRNLTPGSQREREIISSVLRTVKERFSEDSLTLESISSNLYVSSSLLSRLFKRCVGKPFSDYLREIRMAHACRLLKETDMTVDQILLSCGLRDLPSFYRSFHIYANMTPAQYRNKNTDSHMIGMKGEKIMIVLSEISENLQRGKAKIVKELVQKAIDEGADPAAVVYDAVAAAKARKADVLLCDTAGRLHNKKNLMEELRKINKIIDREYPDAFKETLIVLDGTTGQNALEQARQFKEVADVTGIILTKLDGTAKGGIAVAIQSELNVPVKYIGVGEGIDDLQKFDSDEFVNALFDVKE